MSTAFDEEVDEHPGPALEQTTEADDFAVSLNKGIETAAPVKPPGRKRLVVLTVLGCIALVGITVAVVWAVHASHYESTDDAFVEGHVVPVSPQIAARVLKVNVDDNSMVNKGDVLVELDPTDFQVALDQARGDAAAKQGELQQAQAQITAAQAGVAEAQAELDVVLSNLVNAGADYKRYQELSSKEPGAVSKQQMDSVDAEFRSSNAQVEQAKAKLEQMKAQILTAQANEVAARGNLDKATADVHKAEVNLSYCNIIAPEKGRVTRKNVEPGAYVQVGQDLFAIVPANVWVVANFKETQLAKMRPGQPVTIKVDAYPDRDFSGTVDSIQSGTGSRFSMLPAENATGNFVHVVQRVPTKITVRGADSDPNQPLVPGMSVEPEVEVTSH